MASSGRHSGQHRAGARPHCGTFLPVPGLAAAVVMDERPDTPPAQDDPSGGAAFAAFAGAAVGGAQTANVPAVLTAAGSFGSFRTAEGNSSVVRKTEVKRKPSLSTPRGDKAANSGESDALLPSKKRRSELPGIRCARNALFLDNKRPSFLSPGTLTLAVDCSHSPFAAAVPSYLPPARLLIAWPDAARQQTPDKMGARAVWWRSVCCGEKTDESTRRT